ncbi:MAG: pyridoxal-phosphate dependent enzyme [Desulfovibrio sp.]|nr:pyridoxal-phosphate dependent enzyme [Desulfovibrio sp.]
MHAYCPACRKHYGLEQGLFACPGYGDGREHILDVHIEASSRLADELLTSWSRHGQDPLAAFACLGAASSVAGPRFAGLRSDLQEGLSRLESRSLAVTPLLPVPELGKAIGHGGVLAVKDETGQPGGSHKVRHLAGTMLYLEALRGGRPKRPLAISSCGNAALAAACVARAAGYGLKTFVPEDVSPEVAELLRERGADVVVVPRLSTGGGDPCYLAFREAVRDGAVPFCCSGRDNWSNIEGGRSLGYEAALQWRALAGEPGHLVLQIGGGALARSVAQAFETLHSLGILENLPRIHACQTEGAFPFVRAWLALLAETSKVAGMDFPLPEGLDGVKAFLSERDGLIAQAVEHARLNYASEPVRNVFDLAADEPLRFMCAWPGPAPHSLAHGILDDETYDWYFLARAMLRTGGRAVIASESLIARAHELALKHTPVSVSPTGSAGLAGLLALKQARAVEDSARVGLFFTGINR